MYTNTTQYLRALASDLVHGCRRTAADGTVIYTPDGTASYDGLWLRDFPIWWNTQASPFRIRIL